jgi:hypothetical protein
MFIFLLIIFFTKANQDQIVINRSYVENPLLYKNEICSYNGEPKVNSDESVECTCYSSFVDEPRENHKKYIGNQLIHCSYQRKKRFTTFFYASLLPIGLDFLYLEQYFYFAIVFVSFLIIIISQIVYFFLSYKLKEMYEEAKYKYNEKIDNFNRNNSIAYKSKKKTDKKEQLKKCLQVYRIINKILLIIMFTYWILDVIIQSLGIIKDRNGVETENDMNSLFDREET